jgi:glycosyltransferase involved in cell wall biosynthesis
MHLVSVVIPCFNEQTLIRSVLEAIAGQTYPRDYIEVVIADGLSTDNTRAEIKEFSALYPDLNLIIIDNPKRKIPSGLNLAIQASHGDIIIRIDAHSKPYPDYIERSVDSLLNGLGENVGGIWKILPGDNSWMALAIAKAASLPLGVGDAMYRHATRPAYVDTVPFGAFKRELLALIGFFNESLLANEDYEFNARILRSGGRIWLDPKIRSQYFARRDLTELSRQYWRYGYWKLKMLHLFPGTIRWRQVLPPLFILSLVSGIITSIYMHSFWIIPVFEILLYFLLLLFGCIKTALLERNTKLLIGIPLAIATMHFSWGAGFLWSMISPNPKRKKD